MSANWQPWLNIGVVLLVLLTLGVAILAVFLIWRDGYRRGWMSRPVHPPRCLNCGYNLSGLTHCRCPECGSEFRLEELWQKAIYSTRSQRAREENLPASRPISKESPTP
jgi:hypothetical protein